MHEYDDDSAPRRGLSMLAWFGTAVGLVVVVAAGIWLANLVAVSAALDTPRVDAPVAVEVSGDVSGDVSTDGTDQTATTIAPPSGEAAALSVRVDAAWSARVSASTGVPQRAIEAYALADLVIDAEQPACGIGWNTLAAIGAIESDHGRHGGAVLGVDGYPSPPIRGPRLDGNGNAAIGDTDLGAWDGDTEWDRAVGPLQFIPDTWSQWGADGNGDGIADPNQIDDAALAAARYLCHSGGMTSTEGWRAAIFSYNHLDSYVNDVAAVANRYAEAST